MIDTGHDARTRAVIAHAERMRVEKETREITKETIPPEVQELLLEMAGEINNLKFRVHTLETNVEIIGKVDLNDLMRKTA